MILNSVVKYGIQIYCTEFKRLIIQISVMNSFMNWILWIYNSYFKGEFMVLNKMHSAAVQYNQPKHLKGNESLIAQPSFQLHWESTNTAASFARPMGWINLETNKF